MKIFSHEFQTLQREEFPLFFLMTGLYKNISKLEKEKSLTFLYRAPKIYIDNLNIKAIINSYKNIFNISEEQSIKLTKETKGYAYAYQLLGNILFTSNKKETDDLVIQKFDEIIQERSYKIIYNELTNKEKEIIIAASKNKENSYNMSTCNISKSFYSDYKKKLIFKGLIIPNKKYMEFKLPRFNEFITLTTLLEEEYIFLKNRKENITFCFVFLLKVTYFSLEKVLFLFF